MRVRVLSEWLTQGLSLQDIETLPEKMRNFLMSNGGRVIDLFRAMDTNEDGSISQPEFAAALRKVSGAVRRQWLLPVFMLQDSCSSTYASVFMLQYVCFSTYASVRMLQYVCLSMYA